MNTLPSESLLGQWFRRVWNEEDATAIAELCAPDMLYHGPDEDLTGPDTWRDRFYEPMRRAFSATRLELLSEVTEGDMIAGRLRATMTLRNCGREVSMTGFSQIRIADGRIVEGWDVWAYLTVLEALGVVPGNAFGLAVMGQLPVCQGA